MGGVGWGVGGGLTEESGPGEAFFTVSASPVKALCIPVVACGRSAQPEDLHLVAEERLARLGGLSRSARSVKAARIAPRAHRGRRKVDRLL